MALKHDAQGFLVGDPIDLSKAIADWAAIRDDVRAIRQAVVGIESALSRAMPEAGASVPALLRPPVVPQTGGAGGNASRRDTQSAAAATRAVAELRAVRPATQRPPVQPAGRDGRGRFVKNPVAGILPAGGRGAGAGPADGERDGQDESMLRSMADRIVGAVRESGAGMEEADPAVKAFNEVAQPMARGYELLTGGDSQKKQEGWLRRIYTSLTGFRKDEGLFNKVATKRLKAIEEKPIAETGGGGGLLGMLGDLLKRIPGVGALATGAGGLLARGGGLLAGTGRMAAGAGRGLLRRIPIIGALLGGIGAATDIYDSETDDTLTRRQKDENAGKAVGGFAGSVGGMLAGAKLGAMAGAIGGPIGVAIGGVLGGAVGMFFGDQAGQIIGDTVGGWVSGLREADIPGKIAAAWSATTEAVMSAWNATVEGVKKGWDSVVSGFTAVGDGIGKAWGGFVDAAKAGWESFSGLFTSIFDALKSIPVIGPAIETAQAAMQKAADAVGGVVAGAKEMAGVAATAIKEKAVGVGTRAVEGAKAGVEYLGNNTTIGRGAKATGGAINYGVDVAVDTGRALKSKLTGQAGKNQQALMNQMAASGITDPTEQAMFMAQMDHESGGFTKMEERFNYRSADRLMAVSGSAKKQGKASVEAAMAQGPEAVAELMYGGRMGNTEKGDAYKFRGRGHIQLTGKDNYAAAGKDLGLDLVNSPELAADPENAAKIAAWYWKKNPKLAAAGKAGNVEAATRIINGGQNGAEHRKALFAKYQQEGVGTAEVAAAKQPDTAVAKADSSSPAVSQVAAASPVQPGAPEGSPSVQTVAQATPQNPASTQQPAPPRHAATPEGVTAPAAPVVAQAPTLAVPAGLLAPAAPVVASVSVPSVPAAPVAPAFAEAPPVAVPMAGGDARKPVTVVSAPADVGQDMRERGIAHIATGGLGAS